MGELAIGKTKALGATEVGSSKRRKVAKRLWAGCTSWRSVRMSSGMRFKGWSIRPEPSGQPRTTAR
jgi:hypothetical protein